MTNVLQTIMPAPQPAPGDDGDEQGRTRAAKGKQGNPQLFFPRARAPAAQRLSASANRLGNQMQRDREEPASSVSRSAHMQPDHRTAPLGVHPSFFSLALWVLAVFCPAWSCCPCLVSPGLPMPSRCPQGSLLAASVLGRYHGRTQSVSHSTAQHAHVP